MAVFIVPARNGTEEGKQHHNYILCYERWIIVYSYIQRGDKKIMRFYFVINRAVNFTIPVKFPLLCASQFVAITGILCRKGHDFEEVGTIASSWLSAIIWARDPQLKNSDRYFVHAMQREFGGQRVKISGPCRQERIHQRLDSRPFVNKWMPGPYTGMLWPLKSSEELNDILYMYWT